MQQASNVGHHSNVITQVLNAGYCLSEAMPEISRCLVSQAEWLVESQNLNLPSSKGPDRTFCSRCSTIWVPGWNLHVSVDIASRPVKGNPRKRERTLQYMCNICRHIYKCPIPETSPPVAKRLGKATASSDRENPKKRQHLDLASNRNAASKKRAKLRKKDTSLESLISKNKSAKSGSSTSGFGLDLSDLMRGP